MADPSPQQMIPPGKIRLTLRDYEILPDDGNRYEILDGELHVTPASTPRHQRVSRRLHRMLMEALDDFGLGETFNAPIDLLLHDNTIVQPDLLFIRSERLDIVGEKRIEAAPDLVVEIASPATRDRDEGIKSELYSRLGVEHYWLVDPEGARIECYARQGDGYQLVDAARAPNVLVATGFSDWLGLDEELEVPLAPLFE